MRRPVYNDDTVVHPDFVALEMRMIRLNGKVIYTTAEAWVRGSVAHFAAMKSRCMNMPSDH